MTAAAAAVISATKIINKISARAVYNCSGTILKLLRQIIVNGGKIVYNDSMIKVSDKISAIAPSMTLAISAKANELTAAGEKVINFGVGEPDFDTPAHIVQAAKDALDKGYTKYVAAAGLPALKKAIVKKLKEENNLDYDPSQIIVSNGAKHSIFNALYATVNEGDEVLIPKPYWLTYPEVVKACGGVPVFVMATYRHGYKVTASQIENMITPRTKVLIFNSPCNPTGTVYTEKEIRTIAEVCERHNLTVISDEIYEKLQAYMKENGLLNDATACLQLVVQQLRNYENSKAIFNVLRNATKEQIQELSQEGMSQLKDEIDNLPPGNGT